MSSPRDPRRAILLLALGCAVLLPHIPFVNMVCYPLMLLVTAIHEMGHALAALLTGGSVDSIRVFSDGSGLTYTRGGSHLIISSAGYVGSTLFGCLLLVLAQRRRRHGAVLLGLFVFFVAFTFFARNVLTLVFGLAVLAGLAFLMRKVRNPAVTYFVLDFVALESCLCSLHHFIFLVQSSLGLAFVGGPLGKTDAQILGEITPVPAVAWALGWAALSCAAAWLSVRATWEATESRR